jgi:glucosylceramidase
MRKYAHGILLSFTILSSIHILFVQCNGSKGDRVSVISSSSDGDRLNHITDLQFVQESNSSTPAILVDETTHYQMIDGFGATFNEAGMICLNSLNPCDMDSVMAKLFDPDAGAGFTLMKSPVAACDFASAGPWYSYDDTPCDTAMEHFTVERDLGPNGLITFIKLASAYGRFEIESPMDFAPDWMYYGMQDKIDKKIKPGYYRALSRYYLKYLQNYASNGVRINNLVLFNESDCIISGGYSSVTYREMGALLKNYICPLLKANGISTKITLGETCRRIEGIKKFPEVLDDPDARKLVNNLAVHGYDFVGFPTLNHETLTELHNKYPDLPIWMTEICYTKKPVSDFIDGEYWGNMIMNDLNNWVSGWIYWNMILDQDGGPWLTSPEHGDPENNSQHPVVIIDRNTKEVTYTGLYYYLSHFSRFVRPGAFRIKCTGGSSQLNFAGFQNSDKSIILNVINNGPETDCSVKWKTRMVNQRLKAHSITTFKWMGYLADGRQ